MIVLVILIFLVSFFYNKKEYFSNDILFPNDNITYPKINNRIKFLIKQLNMNPNKITENDLNTILTRYYYLFPDYITKNSKNLFTKLDIYNRKYIDYNTITYLFFIKPSTYIDKTMYLWNNKLSNVLQDRNKTQQYMPYNITKHNEHIIDKPVNKSKIVQEYNNITIIPINRYREILPFIKRDIKCKIPFQKCAGYDNSIPYYSLPNIYH